MNHVINFFMKVFFFIVFFLVVTPIGVLLRWTGVDYLRRQFAREKNSYWIEKKDKKC